MIVCKARLLHNANLILGEGARWHAGWQKFLFIDIKGKLLGTYDPSTNQIQTKNLPKMPGMVSPTDDDKLLLALQGEIVLMDFERNSFEQLIEFNEDSDNRSNDGACDALGRLWIGTMHVNAKLNAGNLYCYDGKLHRKIANTSVSNGICWAPDNKTLYYIDSFEYNIKAFDFELATGEISNERVVVEIEDKETCADGMCTDSEGMLWVAIWGGCCVNRYDPITGKIIGKIQVDAPNVTSCAFGGAELNQLLITTAKDGLSEEELIKYPLSGALFIAALDLTGKPAAIFEPQS